MRILLCLAVMYFAALPVRADVLTGETVIFIGETPETATAMLARVPAAVPVMRSASELVTYEAGKDFDWKAGERVLRLRAGSRVPYLTPKQLRPAPKSPNSYSAHRDGQSWMLFGPGRFFHDRQCRVDYSSTDSWNVPVTKPAAVEQLPKTRQLLATHQPLKIVLLGDSISTGADASIYANVAPFQAGYGELVVERLRRQYGADVSLVNFSVGGMDSNWGTTQIEKVIAEKPNLFLVAFGMNDASGKRKPQDFAAITKKIITPVLERVPNSEVILISSMRANADWSHASPDLYGPYADELSKLTGPRVAHADVHQMWQAIEGRKKHLDLTGNGLNHPNDFGHRIYAEVIVNTINAPQPSVTIGSPLDHQVIQQQSNRQAVVHIEGKGPVSGAISYRVGQGAWKPIATADAQGKFMADISLTTGWHHLQVRAGELPAYHVPHVGVGEVFIIAGQSNSANHGSERLRVQTGNVTTKNGRVWQIAHDPQPVASGTGGSFAPAFGDALATEMNVPVGIYSVGVGATSVREWLPKGTVIEKQPTTGANVTKLADGRFEVTGALYARLKERIVPLGKNGFRAILWHQGESDASQAKDGYPADRQISGADYVKYMEQLIQATRKDAGWEIPWFNALATYHSTTTPGDPEFREAQTALQKKGITLAGPDTDAMVGDLRAPDGIHFSGKGNREHGQQWAKRVAVWLKAMK